MRPLLLALAATLALSVAIPAGVAADLTTLTDVTLSCSDNHSVVMTLDQTGLTNLLADVQSVNTSGLLSCSVTTDPSSGTADWTVYDYNPSGQAIAPGATPLTRTWGASSTASERVIAARPALAMLYSG